MNVLDLFSGIGGFSLGLERAGMRTVAFCEIEPYARAVLAKHWPHVPCYDDVRSLTADRLRADGIAADVICGGFPCQDISFAGSGAGLAGERSGLWFEYARIIGELRPRFVIVENVAALLSRGLDRVLGDLASFGYDAEWHCIPAAAVGAPHRRDRIWIVAYPRSQQHQGAGDAERRTPAAGLSEALADASSERQSEARQLREQPTQWIAGGSEILAHPSCQDVERQCLASRIQEERSAISRAGWWSVEPDVGRVANGVPARVDRLKGLGNAVVPQIPEIIGRAIMSRLSLTSA